MNTSKLIFSHIVAAALLLASASARAQTTPLISATADPPVGSEAGASYPEASSKGNRERVKFAIAYSIAFPTADLHDFNSITSFRGFDFAVLWPVFRGLHVGPSLGFNMFYDDKSRTTYQVTNNSALTAKLYRYTDYWTISALARYVFMEPSKSLRPYAGLRLGVAALSTTTLVVDTSRQDAPVGFLMVPEAGVLFRFTESVLGFASLQYNFSTASTASFDSLSFAAVQLGLSIQ